MNLNRFKRARVRSVLQIEGEPEQVIVLYFWTNRGAHRFTMQWCHDYAERTGATPQFLGDNAERIAREFYGEFTK